MWQACASPCAGWDSDNLTLPLVASSQALGKEFDSVPGVGFDIFYDQATAIWILKVNLHIRARVVFETNFCINCHWEDMAWERGPPGGCAHTNFRSLGARALDACSPAS